MSLLSSCSGSSSFSTMFSITLLLVTPVSSMRMLHVIKYRNSIQFITRKKCLNKEIHLKINTVNTKTRSLRGLESTGGNQGEPGIVKGFSIAFIQVRETSWKVNCLFHISLHNLMHMFAKWLFHLYSFSVGAVVIYKNFIKGDLGTTTPIVWLFWLPMAKLQPRPYFQRWKHDNLV